MRSDCDGAWRVSAAGPLARIQRRHASGGRGHACGHYRGRAAQRVMRKLLFEIGPLDFALFHSGGCGLGSLSNRHRATRVDPTTALLDS